MRSLGVVIARFQAHKITPAHELLLTTAMEGNDRLAVFLGVHPVPRKKDPLDLADRMAMLYQWWSQKQTTLTRDSNLDFVVLPLFDQPSDKDWADSVDTLIASVSLGGKTTLYCGPDGAAHVYKRHSDRHDIKEIANFEKHATSVRAELTPRQTEDYRVGKIVATEHRFVNPFPCVDAFIVNGTMEKVLLGRKTTDLAGHWRLIGGFANLNESYEDAACRETQEETGLPVSSLMATYAGSAPVEDWRYRGGPEGITTAVFVVVSPSDVTARPADDIAELTWFEVKGLSDDYIYPPHRPLVRMALSRLADMQVTR